MKYTGILKKDHDALILAEDVQRGVYSNNPAFFLSELEAWYKRRASDAIRGVVVYERNDKESNGVTVYMRCLEAVGVDVDVEAEHVRQVMRDAINESKTSTAKNKFD